MGGAIPIITALSNVFRGQQQGAQASDQYQEQLRQQQVADQLQRALLMGKLQDYQRSETARGALAPDDQKFLDLYGPEALQKRNATKSRADDWRGQLIQMAQDPSKTPEQKVYLYRMALKLQDNPDAAQDVEAELRASGLFTREAPDPAISAARGKFYKDIGGLPVGATASDASGLAASAASAGVPEGDIAEGMRLRGFGTAENPSQKTLDSPLATIKGINVVTPDGVPWSNPMDTLRTAISKGGVVLSDQGKQALALNEAANDDLDNLLATGQAVLPGATASRFAKGAAPYKVGAEAFFGVPDASAYNAAKIALITHLRAVANAARVNQQELAQVNGALANAHSYPALQAAVEQARSLLAKSRKYLVKTGSMNIDTGNPKLAPSKSDMPPVSMVPLGTKRKISGSWYQNADGTVEETTGP